MNNKIEVGEYVRVNNDNRNCIGIGKATRLVNESVYVNMNNKYNFPVCFQINNIVKHSKQLIDLVECGDFINGYRVTDKYLFAGEKPVLETEGNDTNCKCLCEKDIKIILTKESYMANCYKVGGEDEF